MEEIPLPPEVKDKILKELGDTPLVREALNYIYIRISNGEKQIIEKFDRWDNHGLMFAVHSCLKKAKEIIG